MEKGKRSGSLKWTFLKLIILPIFFMMLIITIFSANSFAGSMRSEVENGLRHLNSTVLTMYDMIYPGDYFMVEDQSGLYLFKGEHQINGDFSIIDAIKEKTGVEITIAYNDVRVITTLMDDEQNRLIGTRINSAIVREVIGEGAGKFYPRISVGGENYFGYYAPLLNSDGTIVGMLFVAKPSEEVEKLVWRSIRPMIWIALVSMVFAGIIAVAFSNKLLYAIMKIENLLKKTANGDLQTELDPAVLKREDELGDMGRYVIRMQKSLRELVEQDQLTGLHNRRSAEKKLKQTQKRNLESGVPFCVAIADIDFFKRVNDTYGHECGDVVLMDVSARLREQMRGKGFAARWGGEEFLLVFDSYRLDQAADCLEGLLGELRKRVIRYRDTAVQVTMTIGVAEGSDDLLDHIIRSADEKLYYGKEHGRNQIVQ